MMLYSISILFSRARDGLLAYMGERPASGANSDFILLGLLNGSIYLDIGGHHSTSVISSSSQLYNA